MLKTLLKKQFLEINKAFFIDQKNGKTRTKTGTIVYISLYALLMVGFMGGMFSFLSWTLAGPLVAASFDWLYFLIMLGIAIVLGIFGSVFSSYSSLYLSTDNDLLLSMPIPVRYIMTARLMGVYLMDLLFTLIVLIPMTVVYWIVKENTFLTILGPIVVSFITTLLVLVLSTGLGWVVARLSTKMKNKSLATTAIALAGIGLYYFVYFKAVNIINEFLANISTMEIEIKGGLRILYAVGSAAAGNPLYMLIVSAIIIAIAVLVFLILDRSFIKIVTTKTGAAKIRYTEKNVKPRSQDKALLFKEIKRFTSSSTYLLNGGIGSIIMVALAVFFFIKGSFLSSAIYGTFGDAVGPMLPTLFAGAVGMAAATVLISAPSVSLEGKSLWIVQTLPVSCAQVLKAKLRNHLLFTLGPGLLLATSTLVAFRTGIVEWILVLALSSALIVLQGEFGLFLNLKRPNLNWSNETMVVKQSMAVTISMFGGWILTALIVVSAIFLSDAVGGLLLAGLWTIVIGTLAVLLYCWLGKKGSAILARL